MWPIRFPWSRGLGKEQEKETSMTWGQGKKLRLDLASDSMLLKGSNSEPGQDFKEIYVVVWGKNTDISGNYFNSLGEGGSENTGPSAK